MVLLKLMIFFKSFMVFIRRKTSMVLIAFMLGMSNVILEEIRMVDDTREHIEQQEIQPEEGILNSVHYEDL